jgi:hypothetical protein
MHLPVFITLAKLITHVTQTGGLELFNGMVQVLGSIALSRP